MTINGWLQIVLFSVVILAMTKPLGAYMYRVFEGSQQPLPRLFGPIERLLYRLSGVDPKREQSWKQYAFALLAFSLFGVLVTYGILRLQALRLNHFNPQKLAGRSRTDLAFNTAASFTTNTNWQSYTGEATMSYLTQMAGLAWHNFISAAAGIAVALAVARGLTRRLPPDAPRTIGNFWVDLIRSIVYVLMPISVVVGAVLGFAGRDSEFLALSGSHHARRRQRKRSRWGRWLRRKSIKELGTNGGGFFNANSAHPFENPTPLTNFLEMVLIFIIPAGLTYTFGRMAGDQRQGWAIFAAMAMLFLVGRGGRLLGRIAGQSAIHNSADLAAAPSPATDQDRQPGNMEGKEVASASRTRPCSPRSRPTPRAAPSTRCTTASRRSAAWCRWLNIQLGEIDLRRRRRRAVWRCSCSSAVGVHRRADGRANARISRQEDRIARDEIRDALHPDFPVDHSGLRRLVGGLRKAGRRFCRPIRRRKAAGRLQAAAADTWYRRRHATAVRRSTTAVRTDCREILYAYTSGAGNNGSAFAGLNANTPWWNITLATDDAGRAVPDDRPRAGNRRLDGRQEDGRAGSGHVSDQRAAVHGAVGRRDRDRRGVDIFPGTVLGPDRRAFSGAAGKLF